MKQTIRLNENELKQLIREAINELSPELLSYASNQAYNQGRNKQGAALLQGANRAFNRDYGWEDEPCRDDDMVSTHRLSGINVKLDGCTPQGFTGDEACDFVMDNAKAAQRNRYINGEKAKERMRNGQDPNGAPYGDRISVKESNEGKKIVKESMDKQSFKDGLINAFRSQLQELFNEVIEKANAQPYDWYAEEYANILAEDWAKSAVQLLNSSDWHYPQNNFRPLDFVMNEQGIHNFQELLDKENPVEIFTDWFWECYGTYNVKYNFSNGLDDLMYEDEEENGNQEENALNEAIKRAIRNVLK